MSNHLLSTDWPIPLADSRSTADRRSGTQPRAGSAPETPFAYLDRFGLVILDQHGRITLWNPGAEVLTGFATLEIVGQHLSRLYPAQEVAAGLPDFDLNQARCKKKMRCEGWRVQKVGAPIWLGFEISRLLDQNKRHCGYSMLMVEPLNRPGDLSTLRVGSTGRRHPNKTLPGHHGTALINANALLQSEVADRRRIERQLLESQTLLRELAAHQDEIKEDERKRIAREIHDDLGQNLLALRLDVSMLLARSGTAHPRLSEKVSGSLRHIDAIMTTVRAIINNLRPGVLDFGLHAAIEWQVKEFERRSGIVCQVRFDREECEVDDQRGTALFRILQESLTNINRHAQATLVNIVLRRDDKRLSLSIADNGIGIRPGCRRKVNSFGLVGIAERISRLGGEMTIDSALGRGTILRMTIPLDHEVCAS